MSAFELCTYLSAAVRMAQRCAQKKRAVAQCNNPLFIKEKKELTL